MKRFALTLLLLEISSVAHAATVTAKVIALDQVVVYNRLGSQQPGGMIYALARDVVSTTNPNRTCDTLACNPGQVQLRPGKRPRPLVLRVNAGDDLVVTFTNLLASSLPPGAPAAQTFTRRAGLHIQGVEWSSSSLDDASFTDGNNTSYIVPAQAGNVPPGSSATYRLHAPAEGTYLLTSVAGPLGGTGAGQTSAGLFGALHVEPQNSKWYRSQVTNCELKLVQQGATSGGQPIIPLANYDKVYGTNTCQDHQLIPANTPVLAMLSSGGEIVHSDLTAMIIGPNGGRFNNNGSPDYQPNYAEPNRLEPFREFTIIYHSDFNTAQAFAGETPNPLIDAFNPGSDAFGINYGIAGIFAEIYANRIGVGPMAKCTECKFEEFFLSAWTVGDPAMVVDLPANCTTPAHVCSTTKTAATKAMYPDDPSNVYHSYLNDHVTFRILSADSDLHHIHHQHAHQWLHSPNSPDSAYLDSQAIGPGSTFTLEISYDGSGNRNKTIGDSIFHCHFYPHFAQGMWSMWRVHDAFEAGTVLDSSGAAAVGSRALPDGEIQTGTPIPAIVPMPSLAMAPMPSPVFISKGQVVFGTPASPDPPGANVTVNPGYPFFIPGTAGQRATNPPLDTAKITDPTDPWFGKFLDGGLPRNLSGSGTFTEFHTIYNFSKDVNTLDAKAIPEDGTPVEKVAMAFSQNPAHPSFLPDGTPGTFATNGLGPQPGAPYADPCKAVDNVPMDTVHYKAADIQLDVILNKKGWHYPQQRMLALWGDVAPTLFGDATNGQKAPEPLFFRANSGSCIDYWLTNLVPNYYELDNFQVRTPTDIIGQHIHLVKFDVTSSDGAANGFNYEDGTDSPQEVQERIKAINANGGLLQANGTRTLLTPVAPYFFCTDPTVSWFNANCATSNPNQLGAWVGARTTVQRWFADPLRNGDVAPGTYDRTLRTVFTHDHFAPSTHQQAGLYAGLLVEPTGSTWFMPDPKDPTKEIQMGARTISEGGSKVADGGPTGWQAEIHTGAPADSYREFALEFQDMQLAYLANSKTQNGGTPGSSNSASTFGLNQFGWYDALNTVVNPPPTNPPTTPPATTPSIHKPAACCVWPQIVSEGFQLGTYSLNYRNEPVPFRVWNPTSQTQPTGQGGDLSGAFRSIQRADVCLNQQPQFPANLGMFSGTNLTCGGGPGSDPRKYPAPLLAAASSASVLPADPYTPLIRAYQNDKVQIRVLVGSHLAMHDFSIPGLNWLFEPSDKNSGYRNTQAMGISEHFEFLFTMPPTQGTNGITDYPYIADNSDLGLQNGVWGLIRSYNATTTGKQPGLPFLPSNPQGTAGSNSGSCPGSAPVLAYNVSAISADNLPSGKLIYNERLGLYNKNGLVYVLDSDLPNVKSGAMPVQPLVLRANAGDCIKVTLTNRFDPSQPVFQPSGAVDAYGILGPLNAALFDTGPNAQVFSYGIQTVTSSQAGLNPQLVVSDPTTSLGMNVGINPPQTACPSGGTCPNSVTYTWYAGELYDAWTGQPGSGGFNPHAVEFGAANLSPSDPTQQPFQGLFGALVIEPAGATYAPDANSTVSATINTGSTKFREFVAVVADNVGQMFTPQGAAQPSPFTYNSSVNYGSEPWVMRLGVPVDFKPRGQFNTVDLSCGLSNKLITKLRFGATQLPALQAVGEFATPVFAASAGDTVRFRVVSPADGNTDQIFEIHGHVWQEEPYTNNSTILGANPLSQWQGSRMGQGSRNHFDVLLNAGGTNKKAGDYLYRTHAALAFRGGMFGTFRVGLPGQDTVTLTAKQGSTPLTIYGYDTVQPSTGQYATSVQLKVLTATGCNGANIGVPITPVNGVWSTTVPAGTTSLCAVSNLGGVGVLNLAKQFPEPCIDITKEYKPTDPALVIPAATTTDLEVEQKEKRMTKPNRFNPNQQ